MSDLWHSAPGSLRLGAAALLGWLRGELADVFSQTLSRMAFTYSSRSLVAVAASHQFFELLTIVKPVSLLVIQSHYHLQFMGQPFPCRFWVLDYFSMLVTKKGITSQNWNSYQLIQTRSFRLHRLRIMDFFFFKVVWILDNSWFENDPGGQFDTCLCVTSKPHRVMLSLSGRPFWNITVFKGTLGLRFGRAFLPRKKGGNMSLEQSLGGLTFPADHFSLTDRKDTVHHISALLR